MDEFNYLPVIELGKYEHYKGKQYVVLGVGRHTEIDEYFVVYSPLGQPDIWLRPYAMFVEHITKDGKTVPRFKKVRDE